jgi:hypothetical protein
MPLGTGTTPRPLLAGRPPRIRSSALLAFLVVACAYPLEPRKRSATVLVYPSAADVPCEFEVMRRVQARATVRFPPPSRADQERERDRVLARAGERVGADAVVAVAGRTLGTGTIGVQVDTMPSTITMDFEGDAIRLIPGTCRSG